MTDERSGTEATHSRAFPRRNWILLPILSLLTICAVAGSIEALARILRPEFDQSAPCLIVNDRTTGTRGVPGSVCRAKLAEGPVFTYQFNSRGDYTESEGGPKPAGVSRIVMLGTSFAAGDGVPREQSFAVLLPKDITRLTGQKVELYNKSFPRRSARLFASRMNDTLALHPDLILWIFTYSDIRTASIMIGADDVPDNGVAPAASTAGGQQAQHGMIATARALRSKAAQDAGLAAHSVNNFWRDTRAYVLLTDWMEATEDQSAFLARNRVNETQYLNSEPSLERIRHLQDLDGYTAQVIAGSKQAGVPVVAVLLPTHLLAAFLSNDTWPKEINPYGLDDELRAIVTKHGGTYIDILPDFRSIPDVGPYYYSADGHPTVAGHALISNLLAEELLKVWSPGRGLVEDANHQNASGSKGE